MKILEILLLLISALLIATTTFKWKETGWDGRSLYILGILIALVVAWNSYLKTRKENLLEKIDAKFGELKDMNNTEVLKVKVSEGTMFIMEEKAGFSGMDKKDHILSYRKIHGAIILVAKVRNREGNVIALLANNEWELFDDNYEYNNDKYGFELVTKGDRNIVFQIQLGSDFIYVKGFLLGRNGVGKYTFPNINGNGASMSHVDPSLPFKYPEGTTETLFKYPRRKYLGKRSAE